MSCFVDSSEIRKKKQLTVELAVDPASCGLWSYAFDGSPDFWSIKSFYFVDLNVAQDESGKSGNAIWGPQGRWDISLEGGENTCSQSVCATNSSLNPDFQATSMK